MAYGFSVFWLPLSKALGIKEAVKCGPDVSFIAEMFVTNCDWKIATRGWMYTLFFVFSPAAAIWAAGSNMRAHARPAWCPPSLLVRWHADFGHWHTDHQLWMMILGSGVIGGIGLGLGYISPVSTLIKWFPDRRQWRWHGHHGLCGGRDDWFAVGRGPDENSPHHRHGCDADLLVMAISISCS